MTRAKLTVRREDDSLRTVRGKQARSLHTMIVEKGGVTPASLSSLGWAFRLSSYVKELRQKGFNIETIPESVPGGAMPIGRYLLREKLVIVEWHDGRTS